MLIRLSAENEVPFEEAPLALADLPAWNECFITSTSRHVMPVTAIDGRAVGLGTPGPVTLRFTELFETYFAKATSAAAIPKPYSSGCQYVESELSEVPVEGECCRNCQAFHNGE